MATEGQLRNSMVTTVSVGYRSSRAPRHELSNKLNVVCETMEINERYKAGEYKDQQFLERQSLKDVCQLLRALSLQTRQAKESNKRIPKTAKSPCSLLQHSYIHFQVPLIFNHLPSLHSFFAQEAILSCTLLSNPVFSPPLHISFKKQCSTSPLVPHTNSTTTCISTSTPPRLSQTFSFRAPSTALHLQRYSVMRFSPWSLTLGRCLLSTSEKASTRAAKSAFFLSSYRSLSSNILTEIL